MIAYLVFFGLIGFIAGRTDHLIVGLLVTLLIILAMGAIFFILVDVVAFAIGYFLGRAQLSR